MRNLKQLKMQSGDELICEILDWSFNEETEEETIIVRSAFLIVSAEDWQSSTRYYTFRPFMLYQERPEQIISLNPMHVSAAALPHDLIIAQYLNHLETMRKLPKTNLEEMMEELSDSDREKIVTLKPKLH